MGACDVSNFSQHPVVPHRSLIKKSTNYLILCAAWEIGIFRYLNSKCFIPVAGEGVNFLYTEVVVNEDFRMRSVRIGKLEPRRLTDRQTSRQERSGRFSVTLKTQVELARPSRQTLALTDGRTDGEASVPIGSTRFV